MGDPLGPLDYDCRWLKLERGRKLGALTERSKLVDSVLEEPKRIAWYTNSYASLEHSPTFVYSSCLIMLLTLLVSGNLSSSSSRNQDSFALLAIWKNGCRIKCD